MAQPKRDAIDLVPCHETGRDQLVSTLLKSNGIENTGSIIYVARTFPTILIDLVRLFADEATQAARQSHEIYTNKSESIDAETLLNIILQQHKPFFVYQHLLGKCPQITGFIYQYFLASSFDPLPSHSFQSSHDDSPPRYPCASFNDQLLVDILISYFKYLSFNPKWFSSVWNWSKLVHLLINHDNENVRYLAFCCLSIITKPTRIQHLAAFQSIFPNNGKRVELAQKFRHIYENSFKPCIETRARFADEFVENFGASESGYVYCPKTFTKLANVLLTRKKLVSSDDPDFKQVTEKFLPIDTLHETISQIAYAISVNKPCLVRGHCGSGKTAVLDYIAAQVGRMSPPHYIKIQVGDQIDGRSLIGGYVCTNIPGQFKWQPGPLTKAMTLGSWIVFEDIHLAPADIIQIIHSLVETKNLSCIPCCPIKIDAPHPDFRIFFTQRVAQIGCLSNASNIGFNFIDRLCDIIDLPDLADEDIKSIIEQKYNFKSFTEPIIKLYRTTQEYINSLDDRRKKRVISLRDLTNLCNRLRLLKIDHSNPVLNKTDIDFLYISAIECFSCFLEKDQLSKAAQKLGEQLQISSEDCLQMAFPRKPRIQTEGSLVQIGRASISIMKDSYASQLYRSSIAYTKQCSVLMGRLGVCIERKEPVLLVGETGVGKTSVVQHLACLLRVNLTVINLSQQSDSMDLLGGYKPANLISLMEPLKSRIECLYAKTFSSEKSEKFARHISDFFIRAQESSNWSKFLNLVIKINSSFMQKKQFKSLQDQLKTEWFKIDEESRQLSNMLKSSENTPRMALTFSDGSLIRAVKEGAWILLDEINLAEADVLQCLLQILDNINYSHFFISDFANERTKVSIHPSFRLFACMNPSTDVGKKDLPPGIRNRFTEFFVDDVTDTKDLEFIAESYVNACLKPQDIKNVIKFYQKIRQDCPTICDVSGNRPNFSLRTLCRALSICSRNVCSNMEKSLLESLKITFLQQLDLNSEKKIMKLIEEVVFVNNIGGLNSVPIQYPSDKKHYVQVEGFWIQSQANSCTVDKNYIITESVSRNMKTIARIVSLGERKLPILIQGNTSVGKTSLITYMAKLTGNKCYRINNHEHTDLEDYIGRFKLGTNGILKFEEGLLVKAMRKGYWIIFDELNLAPSELLEALNRVLDDNREIHIPETKTSLKAHSNFMLFATQNPPEHYTGRKLLSKAFRNRFIEVNFDEIPQLELEIILHKKCQMPLSYSSKIVKVMKDLQVMRRESDCFNGKAGYMTLRDLFRWGQRYLLFKRTVSEKETLDWDEWIAREGLILLEGRVRTHEEADAVKTTIEKIFKRQLDRNKIYMISSKIIEATRSCFNHIKYTNEFGKLFVQMSSALRYREPVLLCGPTGCGKTTAAQLYAMIHKREMVIYNCHQNTESSDFIGSVRPIRDFEKERETNGIFEWVDGALLTAMKKGNIFLMDEISLADDAVLERINSVLEPARSITLTESFGEEIGAKNSFRFVATMNPGGDYGKRELSSTLRNRLTEIFCHDFSDVKQVMGIVTASLSKNLVSSTFLIDLLSIVEIFLKKFYTITGKYSLREILSWVKFINKMTAKDREKSLSVQRAILDGASLVFFDQFGTCGFNAIMIQRNESTRALKNRLMSELINSVNKHLSKSPRFLDNKEHSDGKYTLKRGPLQQRMPSSFIFESHQVKHNLARIVRAMQLDRPILLEGDPGVGKTSIVTALAERTGHRLIRFNLSEQTDITDLFGSDLPDQSNDGDGVPKFKWHDGPFLRALKNDSDWILLDELNLASQPILEGLNACFDHRSEIYIPELSKKFRIDRSSTRIFASQNPFSQGSARKGLPQSFLNRFTTIYIKPHGIEDVEIILKRTHPNLPYDLIMKMVKFNYAIVNLAKQKCLSTHNGPSDYNLRDLLYWCDLTDCSEASTNSFHEKNLFQPERFVQFVYLDRIRNSKDRDIVSEHFEKIFGVAVYEPVYRELRFGETAITLSRSILPRYNRLSPHLSEYCLLKYQLPFFESMMKAIHHKKMPILVGQTGSGKRSMVKILAGITGNHLNIIGANSEMDTLELLGSYEQKSFARSTMDLMEEIQSFLIRVFNARRDKSASNWTKLCEAIASLSKSNGTSNEIMNGDALNSLSIKLNHLNKFLETCSTLPLLDVQQSELKSLHTRLVKLESSVLSQEYAQVTGNFEWLDSILVRSIKEGSWLLIENANMMNPATLDRLNSLLEMNGSLTLSEKGAINDEVEIIKPHKNFRLILTVDPQYGELSRAMKNRGAEIFVELNFYYEDFVILLYHCGYVPLEDRPCMAYCIMDTCTEIHKMLTGESYGPLLTYFSLNYISDLTHQVRRGKDINCMLSELLIVYYTKHGYCIEKAAQNHLKAQVEISMEKKKESYKVSLADPRYLWVHFMHDLYQISGGDAVVSIVQRDEKILEHRCDPELNIFKPNEMLLDHDNVQTCIGIRLFLELSTPTDLVHRVVILQNRSDHRIVTCYQQLMLLDKQYVHLMNALLPQLDQYQVDAKDLYVDTRNSPDLHYMLQTFDCDMISKLEGAQNRWILSHYTMMLRMILELTVQYSDQPKDANSPRPMSLIDQGLLYKANQISKDKIEPHAEIVLDLANLFDRILDQISNRCFSNEMMDKIMPKIFWINYFHCKLQRSFSKHELNIVCNQLPTLWALTYRKIIKPLMRELKLDHGKYRDAKLSSFLKDICIFFATNERKFDKTERIRRRIITNTYSAARSLHVDALKNDAIKLFSETSASFLRRARNEMNLDDYADLILAYLDSWSNSEQTSKIYPLMAQLDKVSRVLNGDISEDVIEEFYVKIKTIKQEGIKSYSDSKESKNVRSYQALRAKYVNTSNQLSPLWQRLVIKLFASIPLTNSRYTPEKLIGLLNSINGIMISPRMFDCLNKLIIDMNAEADLEPRKALQMYYTFIPEIFHEYTILENQLVGWSQTRGITCALSSKAPQLPEHCPIISFVANYCLDRDHLKVNSFSKDNKQFKLFMSLCWNRYREIKREDLIRRVNEKIADKLFELKKNANLQFPVPTDLHQFDTLNNYLNSCAPEYEKVNQVIEGSLLDCSEQISHSFKLIFFGYLIYKENAPIFSIDPALKAREKLLIYKSELAHIKLELYMRNTLFYWKSGENLQLTEITDIDDAAHYPFAHKLLISRRLKLESRIAKLGELYHARPQNNDGSQYPKLRMEVEYIIKNQSPFIFKILEDLVNSISHKTYPDSHLLEELTVRIRMMVKNLEKALSNLKHVYSLYSDITTNFIAGLSFALQGLRSLNATLSQRLVLNDIKKSYSYKSYLDSVQNLFSLNEHKIGVLANVDRKLAIFEQLPSLCSSRSLPEVQSKLLLSIINQIIYHTQIMPSDASRCMRFVEKIAALSYHVWNNYTRHLEELKQKQEEIYQFKTARTVLGDNFSAENKSKVELCINFPNYEHFFTDFTETLATGEKENIELERKVVNSTNDMNTTVCVDMCKAHMKLMLSLARDENHDTQADYDTISDLECQVLFRIIRHRFSTFDYQLDSSLLECYMLQTVKLLKLRSQTELTKEFDIYKDSNPLETDKLQEYTHGVLLRISSLRMHKEKSYESHVTLNQIETLINRLDTFMLKDPFIKFVTGSQTLLELIDSWNRLSIPKTDKMFEEVEALVALIKSWRAIELQSWSSNLQKVRRKYNNQALCESWFKLYEAFEDPLKCVAEYLYSQGMEADWKQQQNKLLYNAFASFIREFLETATLGDYELRLTILRCFIINMSFKKIKSYKSNDRCNESDNTLEIDYKKLSIYLCNVYHLFEILYKPVEAILNKHTEEFEELLNREISISSWQGKKLIDIRRSFRESHKKMNRIMSRYDELLKRRIHFEDTMLPSSHEKPGLISDSEQLGFTMAGIQLLVSQTDTEILSDHSLLINQNLAQTLKDIKRLNCQLSGDMATRYTEIISSIEHTIGTNFDHITNFFSHKVGAVVINSKDGKEMKAEKLKLCREMYHSKKFALNSIFKELDALGVSYLRGNNNAEKIDSKISENEPIKGVMSMINRPVVQVLTKIVDDKLIDKCTNQYYEMLTLNMLLQNQSRISDIDGDTRERVQGLAFDLIIDITQHQRYASLMYKSIGLLQVLSSRFHILRTSNTTTKSVRVLEFEKFCRFTSYLNDLVERTLLAMKKLDYILECRKYIETPDEGEENQSSAEYRILHEVITDNSDEFLIMNDAQVEYITSQITATKDKLIMINSTLKGFQGHTIDNYVYSDCDIDAVEKIHTQFIQTLNTFLPVDSQKIEELKTSPNHFLSQINHIKEETETMLMIDSLRGEGSMLQNLDKHPRIKSLNIALQKIVREIMLGTQNFFKQENRLKSSDSKVKDFQYINAQKIEHMLRLDKIVHHLGKFVKILNSIGNDTNIYPILESFNSVLFIYVQDSALYLNIILTSHHAKLTLSIQSLQLFLELVTNGFGLPIKMLEDNAVEGQNLKASNESDNTGFGEGQGNKDVSNKLEFESQLDELKTDEIEKKKASSEDDEIIEACDDGIEMSEDIGGEAKGLEADSSEDKEDTKEDDENDENKREEDGLDKEMASVDQEEGKLDENLWGQQPDIESDDENEEDNNGLNQTTGEEDGSNSKDIGLQPQSEDASEKASQSVTSEQKNGNESIDDATESPSSDSQSASDAEEGVNKDMEFSLENEATAATSSGPATFTDEKEDDKSENLEIDMSLSDGEQQTADSDVDENQEAITNEPVTDGAKEKRYEEGDKNDEASGIDEFTPNQEDQSTQRTNSQSANNQASGINDDYVDYQLEKYLDPNVEKDPREFSIESLIRSAANKDMRNGGAVNAALDDGEMIEFDLLPDEELFENAEFPDEMSNDLETWNDKSKHSTEPAEQYASNESDKKSEKFMNDNQDEANQNSDERSDDDAKGGKRTQEDVSLEDPKPSKRAKTIRSANEATGKKEDVKNEEEEKEEKGASKSDEKDNQTATYKHIATDTNKSLEFIDLVSSEDEYVELVQDPNDPRIGLNKDLKLDEDKEMKKKNKRGKESQIDVEEDEQLKTEEGEIMDTTINSENNESFEAISDNEEEFFMDAEERFDNSDVDKVVNKNSSPDVNDQVAHDKEETIFTTNYGLLKHLSKLRLNEEKGKSQSEKTELVERIDSGLFVKAKLTELSKIWSELTKDVDYLTQELCQQLQIVLQPTKMSKYKGDYKSGKKLNMRKIISYIASHYRKDKIWLRRTKPNKRNYNIALAVDNSSSMSENNCRQMTYQSLALLAKSLTLIESGALSVLSFGSKVKVVHDFDQPYVATSGALWLRDLRFNERKTSYSSLLRHSYDAFARMAQVGQSSAQASNVSTSQLLIIISDGRNCSTEEAEIKELIIRLRSIGVMSLFVIIDNLKKNEMSIMDIKRVVDLPDGQVSLTRYMETFPFPFYVILRQMDALPAILSEALRQWFELVGSGQ